MWTKTLDLSKRHCFPTKDGKYYVEGQFDVFCSNPQDHPYSTGLPEFLRWIRFFGRRIGPGLTYGEGEINLMLGPDKMFDGTEAYCENYDGRLKAFLLRDKGIAIVEVHDETLIEAAQEAVEDTDMDYAQEFNNNVQ